MTDAEIIERLTAVRGIGPWTVEMLLIFRMGRPDVLPVTDYGVRKGFALTFQRVPKTRLSRPRICPSLKCCSEGESVGRRSVLWRVGTFGGHAIWPRARPLQGGPAYNSQDGWHLEAMQARDGNPNGHKQTFYLHSWSLLPAAARESLAGDGGNTGHGSALP